MDCGGGGGTAKWSSKHGPGKWKNILKDPDLAPFLTQCSNINLKCELMLEERYRQCEQMLEERIQQMMQSIMAQMMQGTQVTAPAPDATHQDDGRESDSGD
ncbi:hypothetical protein P3X46_025933 [Hevea brasiliensis]|uniref:Uncharacterized protein n=1 Tax=Hevea brasiliensis TaxID=3981 RepID=A0ABQ9KW63_HEVBR|nr:uncharacterized protein LOC110635688 [Hevea brasiliensis]KAJ9152359.1 hypothetical protein P3X46_025933 [Hevea brasiliensis]